MTCAFSIGPIPFFLQNWPQLLLLLLFTMRRLVLGKDRKWCCIFWHTDLLRRLYCKYRAYRKLGTFISDHSLRLRFRQCKLWSAKHDDKQGIMTARKKTKEKKSTAPRIGKHSRFTFSDWTRGSSLIGRTRCPSFLETLKALKMRKHQQDY